MSDVPLTITLVTVTSSSTSWPHVAFISNRLDYCNSLLYGIADTQLQHLQSVQNAAARLVTGTIRSKYITQVLRSLHWLSVHQRITFKVATIVHKCLNGRAPVYLSNTLVSVGPACALPARPYWKFRGRKLQSLQETPESVSFCLTAMDSLNLS